MAAQTSSNGNAYRFGRGLIRAIRRYLRYEQDAIGWLLAHGVSVRLAYAACWAIKLTLMGLLVYSTAWLLMVVIAVLVMSRLFEPSFSSEDDDDWPFASRSELCNTPGYDPNLFNDISHSQYTDD